MSPSFNHQDTPYERPNDRWRCGHSEKPCLSGPNKKGHCKGGSECKPINRGHRWYCTRSATQGGPCQEGPLPEGQCARQRRQCLPRRSVRSRRTRFVVWISAATLAVTLLCLNSDHMLNFISPGPLTNHHSAIVKGCNDCHSAADLSSLELPLKAFKPSEAHSEAQLCLSCHPRGELPLNHHGLALETLRELTEKALQREGGLPSPGLLSPRHEEQNVSCATCHQEHQGTFADIKTMAKQRCQACHVKRYDGLGPDHPEFTQYPHNRRTRIMFDHVAHFNRHFEDKPEQAPETCGDCHTPGPTAKHMLITSFETSCQSCHQDDVRAIGRAGAAGFAVLAVPALDGESLIESDVQIGTWPAYASGQMTPFMRLLLSADPDLRQDLQILDDWDLDDLYDAEDSEREAAGRIALAIKAMVYDIAKRGQAALLERLETVQTTQLTETEKIQLAGLLPGSALTLAGQEWWPDLASEMRTLASGQALPTRMERRQKKAKTPEPKAKPATNNDILGDDILSGDDDILGGNDDILSNSDDILGGNDDILGSNDDILGSDDDILAGSEPKSESFQPTQIQVSAEEWNQFGGWYLDGDVLRYRPSGHKDPFLKAWISLTAKTHQMTAVAQERDALFEHLTAASAPGKCTSCHSIDRNGPQRMVNWRPFRHDEHRSEFTEFTHAAHFSLISQDGCVDCHQLDEQADYADGFEDHDPTSFSSNFKPMLRKQCADCHSSQKAGDDCMMCHNYHVGRFPPDGLFKALLKEGGAVQ